MNNLLLEIKELFKKWEKELPPIFYRGVLKKIDFYLERQKYE